jgi:hypothetical protein
MKINLTQTLTFRSHYHRDAWTMDIIHMKHLLKKYGELYALELDALLAIVPDEFKSMVQRSVDRWFNPNIYEVVLAEHQGQASCL